MERSNEYKCPNCGLIIPSINMNFHQATCTQSQRQRESQMEIEEEQYQQIKKPSFHDYPQVQDNYKKEKVDLKNLKKDPFPQEIICPKCTLPLKLDQLDKHEDECNYKTCRFCREYYPQEIVDEHEQQCYKKGVERQNSMSESYSRQSSQNNDVDLEEDQNNLMINQGGTQYVIRTFNRRTPNGFISSTVRIPVSQMNQQDPWLIMNRQLSQDNSQQDSQRNRNRFMMLRNIFQQSPRGSAFDDIFHRNDDFYQDFTNHGNFMRMNRHLINLDVLSQLLEQLQNPNRGMDQNQVGQIPKIKFKKNPNTPKGEEEKCSICITEYEDGEEIRKLPCNHIFHPECVDTWLVQNSHCPICKKDLLEHQINQRDFYYQKQINKKIKINFQKNDII